ncbi:MAG TPA: hypothetical protein VIY48_21510, partial [Candidatus Paceibacterota bacterium]
MKKLLLLILSAALAFGQNAARMLSGVNYQSGSSYTLQAVDRTKLTVFTSSSSTSVTLPAGTTNHFEAGAIFSVLNIGSGTVTINCSSCTINTLSVLTLNTNEGADIYSDGTNYAANKGGGGGGGGGGVAGSGTPNILPKWILTSTLGDSAFSEGTSTSATSKAFTAPTLAATNLAGSGAKCLHVDNSGLISLASADCGTSTSGTASEYIPLENCTSDQTGNSFYTVASLTNWFDAHWEFTKNANSYMTCMVRVPNNVATTPNAAFVLELAADDGTAGHTANFQTCDTAITSTGSLNVGALSCAANQPYTTTTTAYQRSTLSYNVQSTIAANYILAVKIATSTTGTAPSNNMLLWPYLKIDVNGATSGGGGGSGDVSVFGTPTANQIAQWVDSSHIQGINFLTVPLGGTGLTNGTSGGIPYFSGTTTMASSGLLGASLPVFGGGAGAAPFAGTVSGNTTLMMSGSGGFTAGNCLTIDASGNVVDSGSPTCGGGGSGITSLGGQVGAAQSFSTGNDTNVTITEASASNNHQFSMGWTGTLAAARLNASVVQNCSVGSLPLSCSIAAQTLTLGITSTWPASALNANVVQAVTPGTNITASILSQNLSIGLTGQVAGANGGTGLSTIAAHQIPVATATNVYTAKTLPDCHGITDALNFTQSGDSWTCNTLSVLANPMNTEGDIIIGGTAGAPTRVPAPTTTDNVPFVLTSTSTSGVGGDPTWGLLGVAGRQVSGSSDTVLATDRAGWISYNGSSATAIALPSAASFGSNFTFGVGVNGTVGGSGATITATTSKFQPENSSTLVILQGENCSITSYDNVDYWHRCSPGQLVAGTGMSITRSTLGDTINIANTAVTPGSYT